MIKRVGLFFIVTVSLAFMLWSANYIYHKQSKGTDFNSFIVSDSASIIYIPFTNQFLKKNITTDQLTKFNLPAPIVDGLNLLSGHSIYDFESEISKEAYISYSEKEFSIVFKNYGLSISQIIEQLFSELAITAIVSNDKLNISESSYYFSKTGDFFIISNKPVILKKSIALIDKGGNFDYSHQYSVLKNPTFFKYNALEEYSFLKTESDSLKGLSVSPAPYFKNIPDNFDELYFYGSSRINLDIYELLNTKKEDDFYIWVKNSIVHLKKDSFELLIGIQNNVQNLKYILDEQTLELSKDSLLPTPIFKNNFEINFFKSNYNWKNILPESNHPFTVYTELNNFNIIATSTEALDWYIKEMQLGNNYLNTSKLISIPTKLNKLYIDQRNKSTSVTIDNWITRKIQLHTTLKSADVYKKASLSLPLISKFLIKDSKTQLSSFIYKDSLCILLYNNSNISCYDLSGHINWDYTLPSPLIKKPTNLLLEGNTLAIVLFMENEINIIDKNQNSLPGFPYEYNGVSKDGLILKYDNNNNDYNDYRILININNTIINLNIKGDLVDGWNFKPFVGTLKTDIEHNNKNGKDFIYFKDSKDSLYVLNRKGEDLFPNHYRFISAQANEFITGDITKGNLRMLSYESGYIKSQFLSDGHRDSILIDQSISPTNTNWINNNGKTNLLIEEYNKITLYNEFGLVEDEIQKPEPNLKLLSQSFLKSKYLVFGNLPKNELYLLSSFGTQINTKPILGSTNFTIMGSYLIVYFNSKVWIYELN